LNKLNKNESSFKRKDSSNRISNSANLDYQNFEKQFGKKYGTADSIPYGLKNLPYATANWNVC